MRKTKEQGLYCKIEAYIKVHNDRLLYESINAFVHALTCCMSFVPPPSPFRPTHVFIHPPPGAHVCMEPCRAEFGFVLLKNALYHPKARQKTVFLGYL